MLRPIVLALSLTLVPACLYDRATINSQPDPEKIAELVPNHSTSTDVVRILGAPSEVVQLGRRSAYRYEYSVTKRTGAWFVVVASVNTDARSDRVWTFFDEDGLLTHVASTFESDRAKYGLAWRE